MSTFVFECVHIFRQAVNRFKLTDSALRPRLASMAAGAYSRGAVRPKRSEMARHHAHAPVPL